MFEVRDIGYKNLREGIMTPEVVKLIASIHEYKGRQELFIQAKPDILNAMLEIAKVQSVGASNRIEGIYTTDERLSAIVKEKSEPKNRSEQEIAGYREVLAAIHENYDYIVPRAGVLLQFHRDLYSFSPASTGGHWKNSDNIIEETDRAGNKRVRFQPVPAFETAQAMDTLCNEFIAAVNQDKYDQLLLIPIFIFDFLCIHPFNDGNGRMSRLLTLLLLYRAGYMVGKYISLEMIIEKSKDSYYEALADSSAGWHENTNNYEPFIRYYLGIILNAYKEFSARVEHLQNRAATKPERVKNILANKTGKVTKAEIAILCPDISISTIETALSALLKEGFIIKVGSGKTTAYIRNYS